jgi:signal transduction histidine kinase
MRLAAHYSKASIIISISILIISGLIYYLIINHVARQQLDDDLSEELGEFVDYVNTNHALPKKSYDANITTVRKTKLTHFDTNFFDTPYSDPKEYEAEGGRGISALVKVNGENYIVTIVESSQETEYLISIISGVTIVLTAIFLFILFITNNYVLNGLWRPFYHLLNQVKKFNVADSNKLTITESKVDEFQDLNDAVVKMSARVSTDYQSLKTFTENASHEMMTPLAVITSKLDILIQDETLSGDQLSPITEIYLAANRLARLNQALLLLVKIDNNLLPETEELDVRTIIAEKAQQFQELIQDKKIQLELSLTKLDINANKYLIDVLINNLFSNAIRHNKANGTINIITNNRKLIFQNSNDQPSLETHTIFERFYKSKTSEGTGLGLAIMKNICNRYNFELTYHYQNGLHSFEIDF